MDAKIFVIVYKSWKESSILFLCLQPWNMTFCKFHEDSSLSHWINRGVLLSNTLPTSVRILFVIGSDRLCWLEAFNALPTPLRRMQCSHAIRPWQALPWWNSFAWELLQSSPSLKKKKKDLAGTTDIFCMFSRCMLSQCPREKEFREWKSSLCSSEDCAVHGWGVKHS